jgi:curved DNA-binding protein CbpA
MTDLYALLGVPPHAQQWQIKDAYRSRAKTLHPDAGGNAEDFAHLSAAYAILSDKTKRERYDQDGVVEEKRDQTRALAIGIINQYMASIVEQVVRGPDDRLIANDLVEGIRDELRNRIETITDEIGKMTRIAQRLEKFAGRFTAKKGNNYLRSIIEGKVREIEAGVANAREALVLHEAAIEILADQSFEVDQVVQHSFNNPYHQSATGGTFAR